MSDDTPVIDSRELLARVTDDGDLVDESLMKELAEKREARAKKKKEREERGEL